MYIEAKQCERELSVQIVNDVAEIIETIVSTILNEINEETNIVLAEIPKDRETLDSLFEESEDQLSSISKLMFLVDHVKEVLQKIKKAKASVRTYVTYECRVNQRSDRISSCSQSSR